MTEEQQRRLSRRATEQGVTKSTIVRQILDEALLIASPSLSLEDALTASFGVWSDRTDEQVNEVLEWRREILLQRIIE